MTGYQKSKSLISAVRPNKYIVYTKYRKTDRHAQTNHITNCKSNLYNKRQPKYKPEYKIFQKRLPMKALLNIGWVKKSEGGDVAFRLDWQNVCNQHRLRMRVEKWTTSLILMLFFAVFSVKFVPRILKCGSRGHKLLKMIRFLTRVNCGTPKRKWTFFLSGPVCSISKVKWHVSHNNKLTVYSTMNSVQILQ